jgi:MFS transporter, ACS family, hexuronate transporter
MIGAIGGIIIARIAGLLLDHYKALGKIETGYYIMFIICALGYSIAWCLFSLLVPKMPKANI